MPTSTLQTGEETASGASGLDMTLLLFRRLDEMGAAVLARPLIRYLELTDERRQLLAECPELAAAVGRIAAVEPELALRLGLV